MFECLAERTIALAQKARREDPSLGYDPMLEHRMRAVLSIARDNGTRIVTNMGAANPSAAVRKVIDIARSLGLVGLKVAAVLGDDVLDIVRRGDYRLEETGASLSSIGERIVSANAYLGAGPILEGLQAGADVVITGRAGDPALFLAPLLHEFGWPMNAWDRLGQATVVGHLLECAGQVTGGYFADPGFKDVAGLARLGFPIGEVSDDGNLVITKVAGSGGCVTAATVKEQLLYEIHDPARYLQPDVIADFSQVRVDEVGPDRVRVTGGKGMAPTPTFKVSVGYVDGYIGEGQISYAGPGAVARARLALEIVKERLRLTGLASNEVRYELIGIDSLHGVALSQSSDAPYEVRLRVAGRTDSLSEAARIGNEVETLYTNGPAGGGGATQLTKEVLAVQSVLIPREQVTPIIELMEA